MSNLEQAMTEVNNLNQTEGVDQRGGKKYTMVSTRVEAFRKAFGMEYGIETEIISYNGDNVIAKAVIKNKDGMIIGSGYAEEIRGTSLVNKTSAVENCETSAVGRALASIGLHGGQYASINEIEQAQQKEITIISFTIIVVIIIVKHIFSFAVTFWVQIDNMEKLSNVQKILEAKYPNLNINLLEDNSSSSIFN